MTLKKDKAKVLGETFDDDRIKTFLDVQAPEGMNSDYFILERAYRSMIPENFSTFVGFFVEQGRDINSKNDQGLSLLQVVKQHKNGTEYADALIANRAQD